MHLTSLIRTRRCEIDTLTPDLVTQNQVDWLNSPEVNRFLEARFTHHTVTTQREYVRSLLISREHLMLNIFDMSRNASIGTCSVHFQTRHNTAEIGILIGERSVWGEGYGQEVILLIYLKSAVFSLKVFGGIR
jgi:RimJ/RimL family protein N-acetyltransferase